MQKFRLILVLMAAIGTTVALGARARADDYPNLAGLIPFTPPANFMSLPGVLRWKYDLSSGRWISRSEAVQAVRAQGLEAAVGSFQPSFAALSWGHRALQRESVGDRQPLESSELAF